MSATNTPASRSHRSQFPKARASKTWSLSKARATLVTKSTRRSSLRWPMPTSCPTSRLGQMLRGALRQAAAGIGNDQLHALEAAIDELSQKRRPARLVLLGALADAENLPKALRI